MGQQWIVSENAPIDADDLDSNDAVVVAALFETGSSDVCEIAQRLAIKVDEIVASIGRLRQSGYVKPKGNEHESE